MESKAQVGEKVTITERGKHIKRGKEEMHSDAIFLPESTLDNAQTVYFAPFIF